MPKTWQHGTSTAFKNAYSKNMCRQAPELALCDGGFNMSWQALQMAQDGYSQWRSNQLANLDPNDFPTNATFAADVSKAIKQRKKKTISRKTHANENAMKLGALLALMSYHKLTHFFGR